MGRFSLGGSASHPEVIFCTFGDAMRVPGEPGIAVAGKSTVLGMSSFTRRWMR
ncbi:hypothetical protein ACLK1U_15410 [Escherichia coli]